MRSDHRNRLQLCGIQRQHCLLIFEENDAAFFNLARCLESCEGIDNAALPRMIDSAHSKHRSQDATYVIVELALRNLACIESILEALLVKESARLFVIEAGG